MDLSFTPYFEPTLQQLDRVMLTQHVVDMPPNRPPNPPNNIAQAQVSSRTTRAYPPPYPQYQPVRSKRVSSDTFRNIRQMFENHLVGPNGEYMWFWFGMLFLFCAVLIGLHVFEISKLDTLLAKQQEMLLMMHKQ